MALFPLFMLLAVFCVVHLPKENEMLNILPPSQSKANGIEGKANWCGKAGCHALSDVTAGAKKS